MCLWNSAHTALSQKRKVYIVAVKKRWHFRSVPPHHGITPFEIHIRHTVRMHVQLGRGLNSMCKRMKTKLAHSPTRVGLLNFSGVVHYCSSLILTELKSGIDNRSTSHCQLTVIAFKCNHLDRAMLLLAFLGSWGVIFMLITIGIVDCTFRRIGLCLVPFPFLCMGNGRFTSISMGTKTSPFFLLLHVCR